MAGLDEVDGATGSRADGRHARSLGFLDRLAESLVLAGVHEDIQAGKGVRQVLAIQPTGEYCGGHPGLQVIHFRTVTDDHQLHIVPAVEGSHALHGLLGGQAADEADNGAAALQVGGVASVATLLLAFQQPLAAQLVGTLGGVEAFRIHAAAPVRHAPHPVLFQLAHRHGARGKRHGAHVVHDAHPAPRHLGQELHPVVVGEARHVGLEDSHARQLQRPRRHGTRTAENEGAGQVHHIGLELLQLRVHARHWHADRQGVNARHIHGGHAGDAVALVGRNLLLPIRCPRGDY